VMHPDNAPLEAALAALRGPGEFKRTSPVVAQAERIEGHLAARAGSPERAVNHWRKAERLTSDCGLAFERAVVALEVAEHVPGAGEAGLNLARVTFERLGAGPWLARSQAVLTRPQRESR
jgi:hypothetical protein